MADQVPPTDSSSSVPTSAGDKKPIEKQAASASLPPTDMLYMTYQGNWLTECQASVLQVDENNDGKVCVTLDRTVMHAQGGGQPTDKGELRLAATNQHKDSSSSSVLQVEKVSMDRTTGIATHTGRWTTDSPYCLEVGQAVSVHVDQDTRRILSECHTAGHMVDAAMANCGEYFKPIKGYHFLDGPYVEYEGVLDPEQRSLLLANLQQAFEELVNKDIPTEIELLSVEEADELCNRQAQNFDMEIFKDPRTHKIRVVTVAGFPCPCGGTHVRSTADLRQRQWGVTKIQSKKGRVVRVKYGQNTKK